MFPKNTIFILLIISLFSFIDCAQIWNQDYELGSLNQTNHYFVVQTTSITLEQSGEVSINVLGDIPENEDSTFIICISYGVEPNSDPTTWPKEGCLSADPNNQYFQVENGVDMDINLRDNTHRNIYVSVSVANYTSETNIENVNLKLTGLDCFKGNINVDGTCYQYNNLTSGVLYSNNINPDKWLYFVITIPENTLSYALFKNFLNTKYHTETPLEAYARYGAAPSLKIFDVTGINSGVDTSVTLNNPALGSYVIGIHNTNDTETIQMFISWDYSVCRINTIGENCSDPVEVVDTQSYIGEQVLEAGAWRYYILHANSSFIFYVLATENVTAPTVYGRLINFPDAENYDLIAHSNRLNRIDSSSLPTRSFSESIMFSSKRSELKSTERIWYVGVYNTRNESVTFGTWVNTECPNDCEGRGKCEEHVCVCEDQKNTDAITCAPIQKGFKVEYIILIVVGSCIIVTAFIGVIVYFYRKRTRHTYESF